MAKTSDSDERLWRALEGLDDDLLDPALPESIVDEQLKAVGIDPVSLARAGGELVAKAKEAERLSWQTRARERQAHLQDRASRATAVSASLDRKSILARLDELRDTDPKVGTAIRMAARKRKPEESTDEELRALLVEMETLRVIEKDTTG
jgi:hypothetical protein